MKTLVKLTVESLANRSQKFGARCDEALRQQAGDWSQKSAHWSVKQQKSYLLAFLVIGTSVSMAVSLTRNPGEEKEFRLVPGITTPKAAPPTVYHSFRAHRLTGQASPPFPPPDSLRKFDTVSSPSLWRHLAPTTGIDLNPSSPHHSPFTIIP